MLSFDLKAIGFGKEFNKIFCEYQSRQFKILFSAFRLGLVASTYLPTYLSTHPLISQNTNYF